MILYGPAKLIDIGLDWLTLTTKESSRGAEWHEAFVGVASVEQARGHKWREVHLLGYAGEQCGHIFWGKGQNGWMVRLSSQLADEQGYLFAPEAVHCTRIDMQVTCEFTTRAPHLIERLYEHAVAAPAKNGRPPAYTLLKQSDGACTLYVGSRSSGLYGRIYDKGMEQALGEPGKYIRFELECKDWASDQAVAIVRPSSSPEAQMMAMVGRFFTDRSIAVPWSYVRPEETFVPPKLKTEDAQVLKWLRGPVATSVARLMDTVGYEQTLRALFCKWRESNSDDDIIGQMALICDG